MALPIRRFQLLNEAQSQASAHNEVRAQLGHEPEAGLAWLDCNDRVLNLPELRAIQQLLLQNALQLERVEASQPLGLVAAAALGLQTELSTTDPGKDERSSDDPDGLTIHRGTLRSGDHLEVAGSLLVLGDVNPGARVSAGGDVRVWGRLRGVAHAGCQGNPNARIVALQLRPLQLRIANAVARGPEDLPPPGFCEQAVLDAGAIAIEPAEPQWPADLAPALSD
jgi:septum site-determining protein MinC